MKRDISGWLILDKAAGMTSTRAVGRVRAAFAARKAGHAGTLDPAATGLLAIALGNATKAVPYVMEGVKEYSFTLRMGQATSTDDAEGDVLAESAYRPSDREIAELLPSFTGVIEQVPPRYSAVRVGGVRAYALARRGSEPEISARNVRVDELALAARPDADHAELRLTCGKGCYVRSLARDIGERIGCLGHASALRRTRCDPFRLGDAVTLEDLDAAGDRVSRDSMLLDLEAALAGLPEVPCDRETAIRLGNGVPVRVPPPVPETGATAWASLEGRAVAVGGIRDGRLHPRRVFGRAQP